MGAGLFTMTDAAIAYGEPYENLYDELGGYDERQHHRWQDAFREFEDAVKEAAGPSYDDVDEWQYPDLRTILRNGLYEIGLHDDDLGRVHVAISKSRAAIDCPQENFADAGPPRAADRLFDKLQKAYPLRVRTSAWTSAKRTPSVEAA